MYAIIMLTMYTACTCACHTQNTSNDPTIKSAPRLCTAHMHPFTLDNNNNIYPAVGFSPLLSVFIYIYISVHQHSMQRYITAGSPLAGRVVGLLNYSRMI